MWIIIRFSAMPTAHHAKLPKQTAQHSSENLRGYYYIYVYRVHHQSGQTEEKAAKSARAVRIATQISFLLHPCFFPVYSKGLGFFSQGCGRWSATLVFLSASLEFIRSSTTDNQTAAIRVGISARLEPIPCWAEQTAATAALCISAPKSRANKARKESRKKWMIKTRNNAQS